MLSESLFGQNDILANSIERLPSQDVLQQYQAVLEYANTLPRKAKMALVALLLTSICMMAGATAFAQEPTGDLACPPSPNHFAFGRTYPGSQDAVVECHEDGIPNDGSKRWYRIVFPDSTYLDGEAPGGLRYPAPDGKFMDMFLIPSGACSVQIHGSTGFSSPVDGALGSVYYWNTSYGDKVYRNDYGPTNCDPHAPTPTPRPQQTATPGIPTPTPTEALKKWFNFLPRVSKSQPEPTRWVPSPTWTATVDSNNPPTMTSTPTPPSTPKPTETPTPTPNPTEKPTPQAAQLIGFDKDNYTLRLEVPQDDVLVVFPVVQNPDGNYVVMNYSASFQPNGEKQVETGMPRMFVAFTLDPTGNIIPVTVQGGNGITDMGSKAQFIYDRPTGNIVQLDPSVQFQIFAADFYEGDAQYEVLNLYVLDQAINVVFNAYSSIAPDGQTLSLVIQKQDGIEVEIPFPDPYSFIPNVPTWSIETLQMLASNDCIRAFIRVPETSEEIHLPIGALNGAVKSGDPMTYADDKYCAPEPFPGREAGRSFSIERPPTTSENTTNGYNSYPKKQR